MIQCVATNCVGSLRTIHLALTSVGGSWQSAGLSSRLDNIRKSGSWIGIMTIRWTQVLRAILWAALGLAVVFALYLVLLCYPRAFFHHSFTRRGITLYSDEPIPSGPAERILEDVERRLLQSPLASPDRLKVLRIYICNRRWRFILFANFRHRVGGLIYQPLSDNIFLRAANVEANRLIGPSGNEVPGQRTLVYYIAHEATHALVGRELGVVKHWVLPSWKNEGYADFVAKGGEFDYGHARDQLRRGDPEFDPKHSGLYLRYHLLVAYLLEHKGISVRELLEREFSPVRLEAEILAP
jgi:hypothetical protein